MNRKGQCTNFGNCSIADDQRVIELELTDDFICPECGDELEEVLEKKSKINPKKLMITGIVILFIAIAGSATYYVIGILSSANNTVKNVEKISQSGKDIADTGAKKIKELAEGNKEEKREKPEQTNGFKSENLRQELNQILSLNSTSEQTSKSREIIEKYFAGPGQQVIIINSRGYEQDYKRVEEFLNENIILLKDNFNIESAELNSEGKIMKLYVQLTES